MTTKANGWEKVPTETLIWVRGNLVTELEMVLALTPEQQNAPNSRGCPPGHRLEWVPGLITNINSVLESRGVE